MATPLQAEFWRHHFESFASRKISKTRRSVRSRLDRGFYIPWFQSERNRTLLSRLLHFVVQDTAYSPTPYKVTRMTVDGKERAFYQLSFFDYLICKGVAFFLEQAGEKIWPDSLYSFRAGFSNHRLLKEFTRRLKADASSTLYLLKADVSKYDTTLNHNTIDSLIRHWMPHTPERLLSILRRFLRNHAIPTSKGPETGGSYSLFRGLPTGTPLVPVIENLYLLEVDRQLEALSPFFYARFGDDLVFVSKDPKQTLQAESILCKLAEQLEVQIPEHKRIRWAYRVDGGRIENQAEQFKPISHIEHLGMCIGPNALITLPTRKTRVLRKHLKSEIRRICRNIPEPLEEPEARLIFVAKSFNHFMTSPHHLHGNLDDLIRGVTDPIALHQWDRDIKQMIMKATLGRVSPKQYRNLPNGFWHRRLFSLKHIAKLRQGAAGRARLRAHYEDLRARK